MKKIAFLMMIGMVSFVWGTEDVTVQVISAVYEKSITPAFDAKLKKTGLDIHKKIENGRYVVTLGTYPAAKSAKPALKKARTVVTKDAFIRLVNRNITAVAHSSVAKPTAHTNAQEHTAAAAVAEVAKTIEVTKAIEAIKSVETPKHETSVAPVIVHEVKQPVIVAAALTECDKKELRKDAFAEAINYYKTSPYHRFEPAGIRQ
ncbi:MAG: hypothetical protein Q8R58_00385 [Sulfuricurvum sp.]|nr:hypothetical protein [Sulfuricurvum sp.]